MKSLLSIIVWSINLNIQVVSEWVERFDEVREKSGYTHIHGKVCSIILHISCGKDQWNTCHMIHVGWSFIQDNNSKQKNKKNGSL